MFEVLHKSFKRKIILIRGDRVIDEIISLFCWKNQLLYLDLSKVLYTAADRLDSLGEAVRKGSIDHNVKIALLKQAIENKGLRDKIIVIGGYETDPELEYESGFEEIVLFEREIGEICVLVNVQNGADDVEIEQIPVRKRKNLGKTGEEVDKSQNPPEGNEEENDEEESAENPEKFEENIEEEATPMWNHYMRSGFCKTFHNFRGKRAELLEINMIRQGSMKVLLDSLQNGLEGDLRFNIQVVTDLVVEEVVQSELSMIHFPNGKILRQELPLDIRDLGNVAAKVNKILTNANATHFYSKAFIGVFCPFSVFWETFQSYLVGED